jgi:hypothetical protein
MGEHFHSANAKRTMLVNAEVDRSEMRQILEPGKP